MARTKQSSQADNYRHAYTTGVPVVQGKAKKIGTKTVAVSSPSTYHGTGLTVETTISDEPSKTVRQKKSKFEPKPMSNMENVITTPSRSQPDDMSDVIAANDQDLSDRGLL